MATGRVLPVVAQDAEVAPTTLLAENVGYEVNDTRILSGVNAIFEPRKLTAVMGPSGAGKTTLLNTLSVRAPGVRSGEILVNGAAASAANMRRLLSYMPQDDVMYLQLTVRQLLYYAALMRCPGEWDADRKRARADVVMEKLGILRVADQTVEAVSGGQRKRASAALEFLSTRPLLFMDEPTSGLDSATAKALVDTLRAAAHDEARTVISTIHQPSWTLMAKFDVIVLLAPRGDLGGTVVYHGPPADIPRYFGARGSPVPAEANPADHVMLVLKSDGGNKWQGLWDASEDREVMTEVIRQARLCPDDALLSEHGPAVASASAYPISYGEQYRVLLLRSLHLWIFDRQQGPLILKMLVAVNLQVVLLLAGMTPNLSKANTLLYLTVTEYTMSMSPLVILMPQEKAVILREYRNGVFSAPVYWLARVTVVIGHALVTATFSTFFTYPLAGFPVFPFPAKLARWWLAQALYVSTLMTFGLTVGIFVPSALAGVKAVTAPLVPWIATAGVTPPLALLRTPMNYLHYPNPLSWAVKLMLTIAFTHRSDKARDTLVHELKVHPGNANSCYYALAICFAVLFCVGLHVTCKVLSRPDASAGQRGRPKTETDPAAEKADEATNPLLEPSGASYGAIAAAPAATLVDPVPIELRGVSYRHPGARRLAIDSVNVKFAGGSATVLMGPSGAGKTTLLNLLSGRLESGSFQAENGEKRATLDGEVLVAERPTTLEAFKQLGTLTPQEEVLNEILTVQQTLAYTAEMRSPREWSYAQKMGRVEAVLVAVGLEEKKHNVVGNALKVGISGGQKKRLSIAMDLLAELPIMLFDEPTTGLDAAMALEVTECLVSLATEMDRTVICTVHQPPWTSVLKFDLLVVLAGGRVAYNDAPAGLPDFLVAIRAPAPPNENPADHVMDVLASQGAAIDASTRAEPPASGREARRLPLKPVDLAAAPGEAYPVSEWAQFLVLTRRFSYVFVVDPDQLPEVIMPCIFCNVINGLAFRNFGTNTYTGGAILYSLISHSMAVANGISLNIPNERDLILREYRNGTYSVRAYWFARVVTTTWIAVFCGLPTIPIWYSLIGFSADLVTFNLVFFASTFNALVLALIASIVGLVCQTELAAGQVFLPIGDSVTIYAGLLITKRFLKPYALPIFYGLPISYAFEIATTALLEDKGDKGQEVLGYYDIHPNNRHFDFFILHLMVVFWIAVGYLVALNKIAGSKRVDFSAWLPVTLFNSIKCLCAPFLALFAKCTPFKGLFEGLDKPSSAVVVAATPPAKDDPDPHV